MTQQSKPDERQVEPAHAVLFALRRATAERHATIEGLLSLDAYVDRARYLKILAAFDGFLDRWEPRVITALPTARAKWLLAGSRRPLLKRDIAALRVAPFSLAAGFAGRLCLETRAAAFGSIYVLEGSALGGRVIARRVKDALGITSCNGGAFFAGWGDDTGRRWREFREALEADVEPTQRSLQQACVAAVETFDALIETFARALDVELT